MWELLQKIENLGWKPYGKSIAELSETEKNVRLITSRNSGLWQFVCENRMTKKMEKIPRGIWINSWHKSAYEKCPVYTMEKAEYRIIESALCNEEDLEKFLLDNIKI